MTYGTDLQDGVNEIATTIGETVTFHNITNETYDPATGAGTITDSDVSDTVTHWGGYDVREIDGTHILSGDARTILPAKSATFTPETGGLVTRDADGSTWRIMAVHPLQMQGTTAGWSLQLRGVQSSRGGA